MIHKEYIRDVSGSKTAVLMIHGIAGTPAYFNELIPIIPDNCSVHNILLDGHGKGVEDLGASSMKKWKSQVKEKLDELFEKHEQIIIVGHSMGTLFAIQEAIEHPDKITRLFLLAVPLKFRIKFSALFTSLRVCSGKIKPDDITALTMKNSLGVQIDRKFWKFITWIPRILELLSESRRTCKILSQLKVPCDVFQSKEDELVSLKSCKYLNNHPYVNNKLLYNSGHNSYSIEDLKLIQTRLSEILR